jgi:hypothetical protein
MKNHFFMQRSENEEKRPDLAEKNQVLGFFLSKKIEFLAQNNLQIFLRKRCKF